MYNIEELTNKLQKSMTIDGVLNKRFDHSLGVAEMAVKLNNYYRLGLEDNIVYVAGLLHDCAKLKDKTEQLKMIKLLDIDDYDEVVKFPSIYHAFAGKYVAMDEYDIHNDDILNAIFYHCTGKSKMSKLEQLIFISDFIEERTREGSWFDEARQACFENLNYGTCVVLSKTIEYIERIGGALYHITKESYDYYQQFNKKEVVDVVVECLEKTIVYDLKVYDVKHLTPFYDYSVIASVSSARQGAAAINYLKDDADKRGINIISASTQSETSWFVIDLGEVMVHIFVGDERKKYNLDEMYNK